MTDTSSTPRWLAQAAEEHPGLSDGRYREDEPAEVRFGDICVVVPLDPSDSAGHRLGMVGHLFVVVDETNEEGWFTGMLAGTETELATEVDAILEPECSGLGYEVVAHTRYFGPLWIAQVRRRIGAIEESVLRQLDELSCKDEPTGVELRRGLPLQPEGIDPRYPALRTLSGELDNLTDHCRRRRHDLGVPVLDPALGKASVLEDLLAETGWRERVASARPSTAFRDHLLDALPSLTRDQQQAAMPLLELAVLAEPTKRGASLEETSLKGHLCPDALARATADADGVPPVTSVLTHPKCWRHGVVTPTRYRDESDDRVIVARPASNVPLQMAP